MRRQQRPLVAAIGPDAGQMPHQLSQRDGPLFPRERRHIRLNFVIKLQRLAALEVGRRYALRMTHRRLCLLVALASLLGVAVGCRATPEATSPRAAIDRDLLDVTVPQLHRLYAEKTYTVTRVVQWHLDRIDRYNGVYGAIETVFRREALAEAAREDAEAAQGGGARGPLWGVPIVIKANTSIKGQVTTAGWAGFTHG